MNLLKFSLARFAVFSLAGIALAHAQNAPQTLNLVTGWNAVWLEVEPVDAEGNRKAPEDVFSNDAIQKVITPRPRVGLAEFFADEPGSVTVYNQDDWQQWARSDPANANNLAVISGNRPYLIEATAPVTLSLTGKARFFRPAWVPDRYNLIGFGLSGTPDFDTFFGPSGTKHEVSKIYRLESASGNWVPVAGGSPMVSNEAYWIFCEGPSSYMGPVAVDFDRAATGALNFGGPSDAVPVGGGSDLLDLEEMVFTNLGSGEAIPGLDLTSVSEEPGTLDLHVVRPTPGTLGYEFGSQVDSTADGSAGAALGETVLTGTSATLTLGADRNWSGGSVGRANLYRLHTGTDSASFWLPIKAVKTDLQLPADTLPGSDAGNLAGLWVGEVILDSVTSIVEDGAPSRPASGTAPMRILVHSDSAGAVQLISQVTVMQTKTADPEIPAVPVLVVDPAKIPFFEGVKERNGKKVGLRIQTVSYAMPRKLDAASQATLLADTVTYPDLTEAGLEGFLIARQGRPPGLNEVYHLSWPMNGAVGAGKTVGATLSLDPFHRSNPFRHAFHNSHAKGRQITREISLSFDPEQVISDRLLGSYRETLNGLINSELILSGRVEFRRVSPVDTLDGTQAESP